MKQPAARNVRRKQIWAKRDQIYALLDDGYSVREIRVVLGFEEIPEQSFYKNVQALQKRARTSTRLLETALAQHAVNAKRPTRTSGDLQNAPDPEKSVPASSKPTSDPQAPTQPKDDEQEAVPRKKRKIRYGRVDGIPEGQRPLDPQKRK